MKFLNRIAFLSFILLTSFVGSYAQAQHEKADLRRVASEACAAAKLLPALAPAVCHIDGIDRRLLVADVYQYSIRLKVGEGDNDVIKLHRVVREKAPGVPRKTGHAVFMVHGDLWGFDGAFLSSVNSGNVPREQSIAIYMATRGVDVWGIDLRWVHVPADTTDFAFMKDWNIGTHVGDIATGLGIARAVRAATGSGSGRVALMGWSRGGILAYAYANQETRLPEQLRHIDALIPVDIALKLGSQHEEQRTGACIRYNANKQLLDSGQYHSNQGVGVGTFGLLAAVAPQDMSPVPGFNSFTNSQVALLVGSATHLLFAPYPPVPFYHFNAGEFDASGIPTGLQFTRESYLYDFLKTAAPFQSFTEAVESEAMLCGEVDVPYDDHLSEITVPVLYLGAEGGFGKFGLDTLAQLGSADATSHIVQLYPAEARAIDFGHADLFLADNAQELVWNPLYNWIINH